MRQRNLGLVISASCLAVLTACSPSGSGAGTAGAAAATQAAFTGEWKVNGHITAPWFAGDGFAPDPDPEILENTLTITDKGSSGPAILTCEDAGFTTKTVTLAEMFDGKITDPYLASATLGVTQAQTPVLIEGCSSGGSEVEMSFYQIAPETLLLALNDTVYQFGRPTADAPAAPAPAAPAAPTVAPAEAPKPQ